ncbi:unnamed protein product [Onchocerca flexuosa]|uniref:RGS domain-containing protein n=1 Tax=Onchocerca flexuosa TaxID=387005 RepID=A0A183H9J0_9BILA|nr:unnamed protein product [Onchocerca flexuosa]
MKKNGNLPRNEGLKALMTLLLKQNLVLVLLFLSPLSTQSIVPPPYFVTPSYTPSPPTLPLPSVSFDPFISPGTYYTLLLLSIYYDETIVDFLRDTDYWSIARGRISCRKTILRLPASLSSSSPSSSSHASKMIRWFCVTGLLKHWEKGHYRVKLIEVRNRDREVKFSKDKGDSIFTSAKVQGRKKKAAKCIGSRNLEQFHTTGHGSSALFTNSERFCNKAADSIFSGLLKEEECVNESLEHVFRSSDKNHCSFSECCKVIQPSSSETEQHAVISAKFKAIRAEEQLNDLTDSMVMANGSGETRSSGNQATDKTCIDVEKILHNELYRKPFQQFLEQQFCAENINFYMAVEDYRSIPDSDVCMHYFFLIIQSEFFIEISFFEIPAYSTPSII